MWEETPPAGIHSTSPELLERITKFTLANIVYSYLIKMSKSDKTHQQTLATVEGGQGMVVFVCFLDKASEDTIEKLVKHITNIRLSENNAGRRVSVCDIQGDVLIIPQATLGGKLKGKAMQYHMNVDKTLGEGLYHKLCQGVRTAVEEVSSGNVKCGVYSARQILSMETNGPFTHILEV